VEGRPTDPADVPNQRTAAEKAAAERAASLRAVFASSPRPGLAPDAPARRPGESTASRPTSPGVGSGPDRPADEPVRPPGRRRRVWLVPVVIAIVAAGGGAAYVATRGTLLDDLKAKVNQQESVTPEPRPTVAGVAGAAEPSSEPSFDSSPSPSFSPSGSSAGPTGSTLPSAGASATAGAGKVNSSHQNLALRRKVQSSSDEGPGYAAKAAVDGDAKTRWSSGFADPQWLWVDLGAVWSVTDFRLRWEHAFAIKYRVDVSVDNKNWSTVYRTGAGADGLRDIPIVATPARYVRMYGTQRSSQYGYSLQEFEVR
jgi:hypothetical protein